VRAGLKEMEEDYRSASSHRSALALGFEGLNLFPR
jgi:hypothetical protein